MDYSLLEVPARIKRKATYVYYPNMSTNIGGLEVGETVYVLNYYKGDTPETTPVEVASQRSMAKHSYHCDGELTDCELHRPVTVLQSDLRR